MPEKKSRTWTLNMKKIFKYSLNVTDEQKLVLPQNSTILSVAEIDSTTLALWALVNPDLAGKGKGYEEEKLVRIFGTGNPIDETSLEGMLFVGTVVTRIGLVWHVFCNQ